MKSINSLSIRTILYVISQTFSRGINAIAAFIFVRLLSTEEYGIVGGTNNRAPTVPLP